MIKCSLKQKHIRMIRVKHDIIVTYRLLVFQEDMFTYKRALEVEHLSVN